MRICQICQGENPDDAIKCVVCGKCGMLGDIINMNKKAIIEEEYNDPEPKPEDHMIPGTEPLTEPESRIITSEVPNKVSIQYGQISIGIESVDEDTESLVNMAMQCVGQLLKVSLPATSEKIEKESPTDLDGQGNYEKLMEGI